LNLVHAVLTHPGLGVVLAYPAALMSIADHADKSLDEKLFGSDPRGPAQGFMGFDRFLDRVQLMRTHKIFLA
jgi:hypothetical protein